MNRLFRTASVLEMASFEGRSFTWASHVKLVVRNPPANARNLRPEVRPLGPEDSLEEGMATQSSILAWRIPWTEESGRLQSMGSQESDRT